MLAVGGARWIKHGCAGLWRAGTDAWRRQQREIVAPIHPQHPHPTRIQCDGTVKDVRHGHDTPVRDREARRHFLT
jgi:hypothetical protein